MPLGDGIGSDSYKYPLRGWNLHGLDTALGSGERKSILACQIPDEVLKKMSTVGILETALSHPLFLDDMQFANSQEGWFEYFSQKANVFQELFKRGDAGEVLLKRVKSINLSDILKYNDTSTESNSFYNTVQHTYFFIAQPQILEKLDNKSRIALMEDILNKLKDARDKYPKIYYGEFFISFLPYATVRLMEMEKYSPFMEDKGLQQYTRTCSGCDISDLTVLTEKFIAFKKGN